MKDLLLVAIDAALKAGSTIMDIYTDPKADFGVEKKSDQSPLTIADRAANAVLCKEIEKLGFPILSEESSIASFNERRSWDLFWVVDPLDGTKEFIKKNGEFTVNIALAKGDTPILGVVYLPVKQILYFSSEDLGAYKLSQITRLSSTDSLEVLINKSLKLPITSASKDDFIVVASRSHLSKETEDYINQLRSEHDKVDFVSVGSSIKICWVAEGVADVYPRFAPTTEWDTAAGHAIALAAGKRVIQVENGLPLIYNKENLLNPWFIVK